MEPIVVLAPHASHPPMDGGSYRSWSIAKELSREADACYYFAKQKFFRMSAGEILEEIDAVQNDRGKNLSALRALFFSSSYAFEKHIPSIWMKKSVEWIRKIKPGVLYVNFLWTWNSVLAESTHARLYIDTHNYDPEYWGNLRNATKNVLTRRACSLSCAYALRKLSALPSGTTLVHVTKKDMERYVGHRQDLRQVVLANGCEVEFRKKSPDYKAEHKKLYFLGALGAQITLDALKFFEARFWPNLRKTAEMHVFGSGDAPQIEALCSANEWTLHQDLSDYDLAKELEQMHYLVLPFSYSAGSKLKLVNACGKGIPILATPQGVSGFEALPPTVFVSDTPADWFDIIRRNKAPSADDVSKCNQFAHRYSWPQLFSEARLFS